MEEPVPVGPDGIEEPELVAQPARATATGPAGPALAMPEIESAQVLAEGGTDRPRLLMMAAAGLVGLAILAGSAYWIFAGGGDSKPPPAAPVQGMIQTQPSAPAAAPAADATSEPPKAPEQAKSPEPAGADAKPKQDDPAKAEGSAQDGDPSKASGQPPATTR